METTDSVEDFFGDVVFSMENSIYDKNLLLYEIQGSFEDKDSLSSSIQDGHIKRLEKQIQKLKFKIVLQDILHLAKIKKYKRNSEQWVGFCKAWLAPYTDPYEYLP